MIRDYFSFAWNNLVNKKLRSWLTLLGIFIGVAAVVSLISLGDGLKLAINSQFGISATEVISVQAGGVGGGPPGTGVVNPLTVDNVEDIERLPSVDIAAGRIIGTVQAEYNDIVDFNFIMSMPDGERRDFVDEVLDLTLTSGRFLKDGDTNKIVVAYNLEQGTSGFDKEIQVGNSILIENKKFEVIGTTARKGSFIFDNIISMNEQDVQDILDDDTTVDVIAVKAKGKEFLDPAKEEIEEYLRKERDVDEGFEDFEVQTPENALSTVNGILTGVQIFISMIASISIIVGAIGIVNTMTTSVLERKEQIGIMKSIGAKNSDIFFQFFIESGLMGLSGGLVGVIIGVIIGYFGSIGISSFLGSAAVPSLNIVLIAGTLIGSFLIGAIAGIVPALQAANQKPVDSLRG